MPLSQVMTANPKTVTTADTLFEVARSMDEGGYRRAARRRRDGRPVAIVDVKALVHFLVEHFPAAVYNQASHEQLDCQRPRGSVICARSIDRRGRATPRERNPTNRLIFLSVRPHRLPRRAAFPEE